MQPQETARDRKVARRGGRNHPVNGAAFKRLLIDRAARAQTTGPVSPTAGGTDDDKARSGRKPGVDPRITQQY